MAELDLRVPAEMYDRIDIACSRHNLSITRFTRCSAMQYYSGQIKPVIEHEFLNSTTYGGKHIQVWKWDFDIKGKKLKAVLISALIKLEKVKTKKLPVIKEVEGIDYNVPEKDLLIPVQYEIAMLKKEMALDKKRGKHRA